MHELFLAKLGSNSTQSKQGKWYDQVFDNVVQSWPKLVQVCGPKTTRTLTIVLRSNRSRLSLQVAIVQGIYKKHPLLLTANRVGGFLSLVRLRYGCVHTLISFVLERGWKPEDEDQDWDAAVRHSCFRVFRVS